MRNAFSAALIKAAQQDERVILLTGDHGYALFDEIRRLLPDRYLNAGVAEQNMVGVAAGLAKSGLRPVLYGLSAFVPIRVLEQIKLDICYEDLPVVMIGDGAGFVYGALGASHHCTEDISALRAIPNIRILSPADPYEMTRAMELAFAAERPVYIRIGKCDIGPVHEGPIKYQWGELIEMRPGNGDLGFIATGSMVQAALNEASRWNGSSVWSAPSIKPLSRDQIIMICRHHRLVITLEEHSIYGGLGAAIAEIASSYAPCWIGRIGVRDRFAQYAGSYQYLRSEYGLDSAGISRQVNEFVERIGNPGTHLAKSSRMETVVSEPK
jgi:transketolase